MTKLKDIDPALMANNPFAETFRIPVNRVTDKRYTVKEGELKHVSYDMETTQCVKLFYTPDEICIDGKIKDGTIKTLAKLPMGAKNLLFYVMTHLEVGQDWIRLNRAHYMQTYSVGSVNSVKKAEDELCLRCLLNQHKVYKDVYWINPKYFFSGSRANNFPQAVDIKNVDIK